MARAVRMWPLWLLAGALGASSLLFWWRQQRPRRVPSTTSPAEQPAELPAARAPGPPDVKPAAPASPAPEPAPGCTPRAERRCVDGDVSWFDSCGARAELAEECDLSPCADGACERPNPLGCDEPITGRCDGDVVRTCFGGRLRSIDCAARSLHCVMGAEGAECRAEAPINADARACLGSASRCEAEVQVRCVAGREQRVDCSARGGRCLALSGEAQCAHPVEWVGQAQGEQQCDACGCTPDPAAPERCNGRDDDGDGLVDEDLDCGPIAVRALVVGKPGAFGSYAEGDVERELERVNAALAASAGPVKLRVELSEVVWLDKREWLSLDDEAFQALAQSHDIGGEGAEPVVPILFTDEVVVGDVPKPGVSTLPNGSCGGAQQGRGPVVGLVAVSKARSVTTVAHELGHFLGLCHTHETDQAAGVRSGVDESGDLVACEPACRGEGDGMCDTPLDPGPEQCPYNSICQVFCPGPEAPDAHNLMSYYTDCRVHFSLEQVQQMQHTLALRRGWHGCRGGSCACSPGQPSCPVGMACRPFQPGAPDAPRFHACSLEGAGIAGSPCGSSFDCRAGTYCVEMSSGEARCARSCGESSVPCDCQMLTEGHGSICRDDLR